VVWKYEVHLALELSSLLLDFIVLNMEVCETREKKNCDDKEDSNLQIKLKREK